MPVEVRRGLSKGILGLGHDFFRGIGIESQSQSFQLLGKLGNTDTHKKQEQIVRVNHHETVAHTKQSDSDRSRFGRFRSIEIGIEQIVAA